jgi:glycosyltransferase involved in cell wall biosynthesis
MKIAVFVSFSGRGGVEKMVANLCRGFVESGHQVDLLLIKSRGEHLKAVPDSVRIVKLGPEHTFLSLIPLMRYLVSDRPDALLAVKDRAFRVAVTARALTGVKTRVVGRLGTTLGAALKGKSSFRRWTWYLPMRFFYPMADTVVAVSKGVFEDISRITGLGPDRVRVIENPVVDASFYEKATGPVNHPWFMDDGPPIIVGMGRLTRQKGFDVLLKAFDILGRTRECRLMILGEGSDREKLLEIASQYGIASRVSFPGFIENPYPTLGRAALFVLSSRWEGSPNVLTEALALGVPVVATDCPSGPMEILENGRFGPLVPVEDPEALAKAMDQVLADPPKPDFLKSAVVRYSVSRSSGSYLKVLLND